MITRLTASPTGTDRAATSRPQNSPDSDKAENLLDQLKSEIISASLASPTSSGRVQEASRTERSAKRAGTDLEKVASDAQTSTDRVTIGSSPREGIPDLPALSPLVRPESAAIEATEAIEQPVTDSRRIGVKPEDDSSGMIHMSLESKGRVLHADRPTTAVSPDRPLGGAVPRQSDRPSGAGRPEGSATAPSAKIAFTEVAVPAESGRVESPVPDAENTRIRIEVSENHPRAVTQIREGRGPLERERVHDSEEASREKAAAERTSREGTGRTLREHSRSGEPIQRNERAEENREGRERTERTSRREHVSRAEGEDRTIRREERNAVGGARERAPVPAAENSSGRRLAETQSVENGIPNEPRPAIRDLDRGEGSGNPSDRREHAGGNRDRSQTHRTHREGIRSAVREIEVEPGEQASGIVRRRVSSDAAGAVREAFRSAERPNTPRESPAERTPGIETDARPGGLRDETMIARPRIVESQSPEAAVPVYATPRDVQPPAPTARSVTLDVGEDDSGVKIRVEERNGDVSVHFTPANDELQKALESGVSELLQSLEHQRVSVADLTFSDDHTGHRDEPGGHARDQHNAPGRRRGTETFEVPDSVSVSDTGPASFRTAESDRPDRRSAIRPSR